jgi:hypothetical protein
MGIIADLMVKVGADIGGFKSGMATVDKDVEGTTGRMGKFMGAVSAVGAGSTVAMGFLSDAARSAAEDSASTDRLAQAIRNSGASWEEQKAKIDARIAAGQDLAFTDDQTRDSLSLLVAQTGSVDEALKRQKIAMDLARGANIDVVTASKLLGKVTDENVNVLAKYGIHVEKGADSTELFAKLQEKFGGQAKAYGDSQAGTIDRIKDKLSEYKESIGAAMGPMTPFIAMFPSMSAGFTMVGAMAGPAAAGIKAIGASSAWTAIQAGVVRAATVAWTGVQWLLNAALSANPIGLIVVAIALLVAGFVLAYKNIKPFRDFINDLWADMQRFGNWIATHFAGALGAIGALLKDIASGNIWAIGGDVANVKSAMGFEKGGMVPGPYRGAPVLGLLHAGEEVIPVDGVGGGGGDINVAVYATTNADPYRIAAEVGFEVALLRRTR